MKSYCFIFCISIFVINSIYAQDTIQISDSLKEILKDNYLRKTKAFSNYVSTIIDKSNNDTIREKAIYLAEKLFLDGAVIQVEKQGIEGTKSFKVKAYLNKIKMLPPPQKVTIIWYDVFFTSNFTKLPDGRYEATATTYLRFDGTTNEGKYIDITKKNIQVIIEKTEIKTENTIDTVLEVFLGDLKVEESYK